MDVLRLLKKELETKKNLRRYFKLIRQNLVDIFTCTIISKGKTTSQVVKIKNIGTQILKSRLKVVLINPTNMKNNVP